jgi:hypothetical protein
MTSKLIPYIHPSFDPNIVEALSVFRPEVELFFTDFMFKLRKILPEASIVDLKSSYYLSTHAGDTSRINAEVIMPLGIKFLILGHEVNDKSGVCEYSVQTPFKDIKLKDRGCTYELHSNNAKRLIKKFFDGGGKAIAKHPAVSMPFNSAYTYERLPAFYDMADLPGRILTALKVIPCDRMKYLIYGTVPHFLIDKLLKVARGELTISQVDVSALTHAAAHTEFVVQRYAEARALADSCMTGPKWAVTWIPSIKRYRIDQMNFSVSYSYGDAPLASSEELNTPVVHVLEGSKSYGLFAEIETFVEAYPEAGRDLVVSMRNASIVLRNPDLNARLQTELSDMRSRLWKLSKSYELPASRVETLPAEPSKLGDIIPICAERFLDQSSGVVAVTAPDFSDGLASPNCLTMLIMDRYFDSAAAMDKNFVEEVRVMFLQGSSLEYIAAVLETTEEQVEEVVDTLDFDDREYEEEYDDSMDGDATSALASAGWGTDEDS